MRYVLCKPKGGLNDMLCQIRKCIDYCRVYDRFLYVDGVGSGFVDDLSKYFEFTESSIGRLSVSADDYLMLNSLSVQPCRLSNRLDTYKARYKTSQRRKWRRQGMYGVLAEVESDAPVSFYFRVDHNESVLVHDSCGGCKQSIDALRSLRLTENVAAILRKTLGELPESYISIHVRSSDKHLKCDYQAFFEQLDLGSSVSNVYLSCDRKVVQDYGKAALRSFNVLTYNDLPDVTGNLHSNTSLPRWETNIHCLVDLIVMAMSQQIIRAPVFIGRRGFLFLKRKPFLSGFGWLAARLSDEPELIKTLLRYN